MRLAEEHTEAGRCDHVVHFYADEAELAGGAGAFLREGLAAGETVLVIATAPHRASFDLPFTGPGRLVALDAADVLPSLVRDGCFDPAEFFSVVAPIVRSAVADGPPVRIYGELVALLWERGDVMGAIELETAWNTLGQEISFSLYCAYPSGDVRDERHAEALAQVCRLHTAVLPEMPSEQSWHFERSEHAPAEARRAVTEALAAGRHDRRLLEDARLVVTELAANAVAHARSRFSITLSFGPSKLRIAVHDDSRVAPQMREHDPEALTGRGLRIVSALAEDWGVDIAVDGKLVWADLPR